MKEKLNNIIKVLHFIILMLLPISSIALFIGGFFVPPMGEIDGSVISATGILLGFATLYKLPEIITAVQDKTLEIKHGNTSLTIRDEDEKV